MGKITDFIKKVSSIYAPATYVATKMANEKGVDGRIVCHVDKQSYIAEQYKVLRTNLYSLSPQTELKTVLITSAQSQEGKSVTSCNLSYTLSLDTEKRTLLLDADFRKPSVHRLFGIPRKPGFTDVLNGDIDISHFTDKPMLDNLYIIPSGTLVASTSELLSSAKLRNMIQVLRDKFDYVIFDTPPVINVTDSSILGAMCDAVILVVRSGVTPKNMVEEAFTMLKHAQAKPKACILTDTTIPIYYYYMARYRYYYNYRYSYKRKTVPTQK